MILVGRPVTGIVVDPEYTAVLLATKNMQVQIAIIDDVVTSTLLIFHFVDSY